MASQFEHGGVDARGVPRFDFSTNSNACGPCPTALAAVQQADATHYPDPHYQLLRECLGAFHGVAPERILLAASASEFIQRISVWAALTGRAVWLPPHHYSDYARAAQAAKLKQAERPEQAGLLWCCEPSSPLGQTQPALAQQVSELTAEQVVVLDCAYAPLRLTGKPSLAADLQGRVWQLWTPNKALGLTGVRAAYAIAPQTAGQAEFVAEDAMTALQALSPSWPVGAHGVALLHAWCHSACQAWLGQSLQLLREWKARQLALCADMGWHCLPSDASYFCAQPGRADVAALCLQLRDHGIKLRDTHSFGLPSHVRLAVLAPEAQDALADAWRKYGEGSL